MKIQVDRTFATDVLIVGGGGAALRAAVAAGQAGARVTVVLKGERGRSGATVSPNSGGVAWQAADRCSRSDDGPEQHFRNIVDAGLGMADPRLARILAYEILERTEELEDWGMRFIPDPEGKKPHYTGYSCFGDRPRAHGIRNSGHGHAGDIVVALVGQLGKYPVETRENVFVADLLVKDGACVGALALGPDGEVIACRAGAVVLGAGGARQLFPHEKDRKPIDTTGDGYALALRAGAELTNMEFTQYMLHPIQPFPVKCPGLFWMLFPRLKNRNGEDALAPYFPDGVDPEQVMRERTLHFPFSCRDVSGWLDIAVATEIREGRGSEQGGLFLDFSAVDLSRFEPSRPQHMPDDPDQPIELPGEPVQVRSAAHAVNGGIRIDEGAASTLPGLFAAGEVAAGPHGADRLGGGMVTNCQVFGERAGRFAGEYALGAGRPELTPEVLEAPLARLHQYGNGDAEAVLETLQQATGANLMVTRNEARLLDLIAAIEELRNERLPQVAGPDAQHLRRALEVDNMLLTGELMARAALMRRESRGSHFREDYPQQDDDNWLVNILFRREGGELKQETGRPWAEERNSWRP